MTSKSKFSSRKYRIAQQCVALTILVPVLFKYLQVSDGITQNVLLQLAGLAVAYGGLNVWSQRKGTGEPDNE